MKNTEKVYGPALSTTLAAIKQTLTNTKFDDYSGKIGNANSTRVVHGLPTTGPISAI
jgi:hypothetical protein